MSNMQKNKFIFFSSTGFLKKSSAGFTLIELMVSISIIALMSGLFLANYHSTNKRSALILATQKIASNMRLTQNYSLGSEKLGGVVPSGGWGIYFEDNSSDYIIFADLDAGKDYDVGEEYKTVSLGSNIIISSLSTGSSRTPVSFLNITFLSPNPTTYIKKGTVQLAYIELTDGETVKTIKVNAVGLADIID